MRLCRRKQFSLCVYVAGPKISLWIYVAGNQFHYAFMQNSTAGSSRNFENDIMAASE